MNQSIAYIDRETAHANRAAIVSKEIRVRRISSLDDMSKIAKLRHDGYNYFDSPCSAIDDLDLSGNCIHLVAETQSGDIVGTVRILSGPGPIELDTYIDIKRIKVLRSRSFVEASRLVSCKFRDSFAIKTLLSKACWVYCLKNNLEYLIVTTKPCNERYYSFLLMESLGENGQFRNSILGNSIHKTYFIKVADVVDIYTKHNHPFTDFMLHQEHAIDL